MKVVFVTNVWNHYQGALGRALAEALGPRKFSMVVWQQLDAERRQLGWEVQAPDHPWLTRVEGDAGLRGMVGEICETDVALLGASPRWLQIRRACTGKITFIAAERMWKQPLRTRRLLDPRFAISLHRYRRVACQPNAHYLAIGAYAASDARLAGGFDGRTWAWGYFCDVPPTPPPPRDDAKVQILWAGRMLPWKRLDTLLEAVAMIRDLRQFGQLRIIGVGPDEPKIRALAGSLGVGAQCLIQRPVPPEMIRHHLRESATYVLPSDRNEGWGVVANEAMAEGAVLVANREAGAAPMLVTEGETGLLFDDGRTEQLAGALRRLMEEPSLLARMRREAWNRVKTLWSPSVAAARFVALSEGLLGAGPMPRYECGPCSSA